MIGNDIIDLALARKESNWKRKGFLEKIFTQKEQLMISNAENSEVMVWNLWSRKEAAYKIYNRETQIRAYIPLQLECFELSYIDGFYFGYVRIKKSLYFTKTEITSHYINTIAVVNIQDFDRIETSHNSDNIKKNNGIPSYLKKDNLMMRPMSISHHGKFKRIISI